MKIESLMYDIEVDNYDEYIGIFNNASSSAIFVRHPFERLAGVYMKVTRICTNLTRN